MKWRGMQGIQGMLRGVQGTVNGLERTSHENLRNLTDGTHYPYREPNNETLYIDTNSNHPPTIIKHLPAAIGRPLKQSGHDEESIYTKRRKPVTYTVQNSRKNRQRNIIWFNPPYSMNVQTNIGREFLNLVSKHFPKNHRYSKIFNKNNMKVSYSCTDNLQTIIKKNNRKILETSKTSSTENKCNCRKKNECPWKNNSLPSSVVYNANVTTDKVKTKISLYVPTLRRNAAFWCKLLLSVFNSSLCFSRDLINKIVKTTIVSHNL